MIPELRARGIGEILDAAVKLYRQNFRYLLGIGAIVLVPVQIVSTLVLLSAQPDHYDVSLTPSLTPQYGTRDAFVQFAAALVVLLLSYVADELVLALASRRLGESYIGRASVRRAAGPSYAIGMVAVAIVVALASLAGVAFCFVGIFAMLALFAPAIPAYVLEGLSPGRALGRSTRLSGPNFLRMTGLVACLWLLVSTINAGLAGLVALVVQVHTSTTTSILLQALATAIAALIVQPFAASAFVVAYFDLRIRQEGFDVQLTMQRNDERHAAAVRAPAATV